MQRTTAIALAVAVLWLNASVAAQEAFEVASVKRRQNVDITQVKPPMFFPDGRWVAQGATLSLILRSVYGLPLSRIVGLPSWVASERFDIDARAPAGATTTQMQAMAQRLLADRFDLRTHWDQRVSEVFVLVLAQPSGELGRGLRRATCQRADSSNACGERITTAPSGAYRLQLRDRPLADLLIISGARAEVGDSIEDRTGLVGRFDIDLEFVPRSALSGQDTLDVGLPYGAAIANQLGLRFERREEPVDFLVIEKVSMPSSN